MELDACAVIEERECSIYKYIDESEYEELLVSRGKVETEPGVEIYFEVYGTGSEKLLLVMGLGGTAMMWLPNVKYLLEHDANLQICVLDNRGIGRSSVPSGRYKYEPWRNCFELTDNRTSDMAQDAIKVMDHLYWRYFHVVGISMGGMISQEIALAAIERVSTLILSVTHNGKAGSFPPWEGIKGTLLSKHAKTVEEKAPFEMSLLYPEQFMSRITKNGKTYGELATARYILMTNKLPPDPSGFRSQVLAVQTHSVKEERLDLLKKAKIPILISTGDTDNLVNPKASFYLKEVLNPVEFISWPGCGHGVWFQRFDEFNDSILRHYKRRTRSSPNDLPVGSGQELPPTKNE